MTCSTCLESRLSCCGFCLLHISIMVTATARKKERLHSCHYCASLNPVTIPSSEKPYEHTMWASFFWDSVLLCRNPQASVVEDFSFSCAVCKLRRSMPQRQWKKRGEKKTRTHGVVVLHDSWFPVSWRLSLWTELDGRGIGIHEIWIETLTTANTHCCNSIETHIPNSEEESGGLDVYLMADQTSVADRGDGTSSTLHLPFLEPNFRSKNVAMWIHSKQNMTHSPKSKSSCTSNTGTSFLASLPSLVITF
jgi:hypothetical protein